MFSNIGDASFWDSNKSRGDFRSMVKVNIWNVLHFCCGDYYWPMIFVTKYSAKRNCNSSPQPWRHYYPPPYRPPLLFCRWQSRRQLYTVPAEEKQWQSMRTCRGEEGSMQKYCKIPKQFPQQRCRPACVSVNSKSDLTPLEGSSAQICP